MTDAPGDITPVSSVQDLMDLVRQSMSSRRALVDYGLAHGGLGHPPPAGHRQFQQTGGIIEHYDRDLTVRLSAGAAMGQVQAELAKTRQFLAIDADDDITVGEAIVHNVFGPLRSGYGSWRDQLLGLHYIDGQGRDIHVGGRTVKNVAGYDMTRLMVGSLGEMGIVYEATARTYAIPDQVLAVDVHVDDPTELDAMLPAWLLADAAPAQMALEYKNRQWMLRLGYFGRVTACAVQLRSLEQLLDRSPPTPGTRQASLRIAGSGNRSLADHMAEAAARRLWRRRSGAVVKVVVPPARTGWLGRQLATWAGERHHILLDGLPAFGVVFVGGDLDASTAVGLDQTIIDLLREAGGWRAWYARPEDVESIAPVAPAQSDWRMLAKLKKTLDPHYLFNPGRLLPVEVAAR